MKPLVHRGNVELVLVERLYSHYLLIYRSAFGQCCHTKLTTKDNATILTLEFTEYLPPKCSTLNLDDYIGNINGELIWGKKGFTKSSQKITLEGGYLKAECELEDKSKFVPARLYLGGFLMVINGKLEIREFTDISELLSEVPWMKFKIVAQPDISLFHGHQAVRETVSRAAELAVEQATEIVISKITQYIRQEMSSIIQETMLHVTESMTSTMSTHYSANVQTAMSPPGALQLAHKFEKLQQEVSQIATKVLHLPV